MPARSGTTLRDSISCRRLISKKMLMGLALQGVFGVYMVDVEFELISQLKECQFSLTDKTKKSGQPSNLTPHL